MQKCSNCSAPLQDLVEQCTFCGTLTDRGVQARQARALQSESDRRAAEQRAAADEASARAAARHSIDAAGRWAFYSSLLGSLLCCMVPVGPVLGIVFGMKARGLAAQHRIPNTTLGTFGLLFGVVGLSASVLMWIAAGGLMVHEGQRRRELKAALGELTGPELSVKSACALTELELLDTHFRKYSSLDDFECAGAELEVNGDRAVLRGALFRKTDERVPVIACLTRRTQWSVQLRGDDECSAEQEATPPDLKRE